MLSYAGIGSRDITEEESVIITQIAKYMNKHSYICYSGNAAGSDVSFQRGSDNNCVVFLPYKNFNINEYNPWKLAKACFDLGKGDDGDNAVDDFHPCPTALTWKSRPMICRNYYQVNGYDIYPQVTLVICCANTDVSGNVIGGTGQACRIAKHRHIPVINIRKDNWKIKIKQIIQKEDI